MGIRERLFELQDKDYAEFQSKLMPSVPRASIIGVRVPVLRGFAKQCIAAGEDAGFLKELPHAYYDENMLHGLIISEIKDYKLCIDAIDAFLPYVDNWAVCDIMSPKVFRKNKAALVADARRWSASNHVYACRFGLGVLMNHFLDDSFLPECLEVPAGIRSDEYYVNMMIAWFFATALAKQWKQAIVYLESDRLDGWVHDKTIQKACESRRISDEQKSYLRSLKRDKTRVRLQESKA